LIAGVVAVTVIEYDPGGVPGLPPPPPPPPPPQPRPETSTEKRTSPNNVGITFDFGIRPPQSAQAKISPVQPLGWLNFADGAVVKIVTVVEPLPATVAGLKLHLASKGRPEQERFEKLIVELYPVCPVIVKVFVALPPGELIVRPELPAANVKSACTSTVTGEALEAR